MLHCIIQMLVLEMLLLAQIIAQLQHIVYGAVGTGDTEATISIPVDEVHEENQTLIYNLNY